MLLLFGILRPSSRLSHLTSAFSCVISPKRAYTTPTFCDSLRRNSQTICSQQAQQPNQHPATHNGPYTSHFWTPAEDAELVRLRGERVSYEIIARDHLPNRTMQTCRNRLHFISSGRSKHREFQPWTDEANLAFRKLHAEGLSVGEIALRLDRPARSVSGLHRVMGLNRNKTSNKTRHLIWTAAEDKILAQYVDPDLRKEGGMKVLIRLFPDRSEQAIQTRLWYLRRQHGEMLPRSRVWTDEEHRKVYEMYSSETGVSPQDTALLAETLGRTVMAIRCRVHALRRVTPSEILPSWYRRNSRLATASVDDPAR